MSNGDDAFPLQELPDNLISLLTEHVLTPFRNPLDQPLCAVSPSLFLRALSTIPSAQPVLSSQSVLLHRLRFLFRSSSTRGALVAALENCGLSFYVVLLPKPFLRPEDLSFLHGKIQGCWIGGARPLDKVRLPADPLSTLAIPGHLDASNLGNFRMYGRVSEEEELDKEEWTAADDYPLLSEALTSLRSVVLCDSDSAHHIDAVPSLHHLTSLQLWQNVWDDNATRVRELVGKLRPGVLRELAVGGDNRTALWRPSDTYEDADQSLFELDDLLQLCEEEEMFHACVQKVETLKLRLVEIDDTSIARLAPYFAASVTRLQLHTGNLGIFNSRNTPSFQGLEAFTSLRSLELAFLCINEDFEVHHAHTVLPKLGGILEDLRILGRVSLEALLPGIAQLTRLTTLELGEILFDPASSGGIDNFSEESLPRRVPNTHAAQLGLTLTRDLWGYLPPSLRNLSLSVANYFSDARVQWLEAIPPHLSGLTALALHISNFPDVPMDFTALSHLRYLSLSIHPRSSCTPRVKGLSRSLRELHLEAHLGKQDITALLMHDLPVEPPCLRRLLITPKFCPPPRSLRRGRGCEEVEVEAPEDPWRDLKPGSLPGLACLRELTALLSANMFTQCQVGRFVQSVASSTTAGRLERVALCPVRWLSPGDEYTGLVLAFFSREEQEGVENLYREITSVLDTIIYEHDHLKPDKRPLVADASVILTESQHQALSPPHHLFYGPSWSSMIDCLY